MSNVRNFSIAVLSGVALALITSTHVNAQVTPIPAPEVIPMVAPQISLMNPNNAPDPVLVEKSFTLQAGEIRRVTGRVEIISNTSDSKYVETYTQCIGPDGTVSQQGGAAQNHEGNDTPAGVNYPVQGHLVLFPLLLFQAPATGPYRCQLIGGSGTDPLTAVATNYEGAATTWLEVSSANDEGASWWQNLPCDEYGNNSPSAANGYSACNYLGGTSGKTQLYVFDNDGSPAKTWQAPGDAAFVDASDSLMLTTCYSGTNSCLSSIVQGGAWPNPINYGLSNGTVVDTHLELIQLNSNGSVCNSTQSPDQISTVGNLPHHYMIYNALSAVPVYPCGGSRSFKLRISVRYMSGNPVKIDGFLWTHAFAFKSYSSPTGSAPAIPNLSGLAQGVAGTYLNNSGYAVGSVSYVLNAAPAGTVLSQYPAAGIIELPGSGVNFTVSTGGVIVPNLLSLSQSSATSQITRLGLVPKVGFQKECINPGDVLVQSPQAGTTVALGSTVSLTVDSGTYKTCVIK